MLAVQAEAYSYITKPTPGIFFLNMSTWLLLLCLGTLPKYPSREAFLFCFAFFYSTYKSTIVCVTIEVHTAHLNRE